MKSVIIATLLGVAAAAPAVNAGVEAVARRQLEDTIPEQPAPTDVAGEGAGTAVEPTEEELAFLTAVEDCQIKLAAQEVESLDQCVLDALGIERRIQARQDNIEEGTLNFCNVNFEFNTLELFLCYYEVAGVEPPPELFPPSATDAVPSETGAPGSEASETGDASEEASATESGDEAEETGDAEESGDADEEEASATDSADEAEETGEDDAEESDAADDEEPSETEGGDEPEETGSDDAEESDAADEEEEESRRFQRRY